MSLFFADQPVVKLPDSRFIGFVRLLGVEFLCPILELQRRLICFKVGSVGCQRCPERIQLPLESRKPLIGRDIIYGRRGSIG